MEDMTDSEMVLVLEIGCFTGFSALGWAEAVKDMPDAKVSNTRTLTMDICTQRLYLAIITSFVILMPSYLGGDLGRRPLHNRRSTRSFQTSGC